MLTLKLIKLPVGFDAFVTTATVGAEERPYVENELVPAGQYIRLRRQPQFTGSAEILYEVNGNRVEQETGTADVREDTVVPLTNLPPMPDGKPVPEDRSWRLQTNCEILQKT